MSENGDGRQDGTFLPLPLPRQFSHEGRRGSLGKRLFTRQITFTRNKTRDSYGERAENRSITFYDKYSAEQTLIEHFFDFFIVSFVLKDFWYEIIKIQSARQLRDISREIWEWSLSIFK